MTTETIKRYGFTCNGVRWEVFTGRPLGEGLITTPENPNEVIQGFIGMIPSFITIEALDASTDELMTVIEKGYCWEASKLGGTVNSEGVYQYPEDPDLYPVACSLIGAHKVYIYAYGITAIVKGDQQVIIRLD